MIKNTKVILTVDTECFAGGWPQRKNAEPFGYDSMMLCKIGSKEYGIRHIMDVAEQYALVVNFFVEPLCSYKLGISQLRDICQEVITRGHGISLHIHPRWKLAMNPDLRQLTDSMYDFGIDEQEQLIREGLQILSECGVNNVNAFRAGNLHGDAATYEALRRVGIPISSNYCSAWHEKMLSRYGFYKSMNDVTLVNGILEIPVTSFHDLPNFSPKHLRPLQIAAASSAEFREVILSATKKHYKFVVILFHTFEWIYLGPNRTLVLNEYILNRFHELCAFLHGLKEKIDVCTFSNINTNHLFEQLNEEEAHTGHYLQSSDLTGTFRMFNHSLRRIGRKCA